MMLPGRTAEGLGALVRLLAPQTQTAVFHHDRCRVPLKASARMSMRQPLSLKHRPVMGTYATDVNGQVLLMLTTDDAEEARGWLPGGELNRDLNALLHVYLGVHLNVRMQLRVPRHLLADARLCCKPEYPVQLGRTALLKPLNVAARRNNEMITIPLGRWEQVQKNIHRRESDEDGEYRW